jgi:ANTAR domain
MSRRGAAESSRGFGRCGDADAGQARDGQQDAGRHPGAGQASGSHELTPAHQEAVLGALNIYATQPAMFDRDAIEIARTFAGYAAVAIANARLYHSTATLAQDMRRPMETRAVIEQAKGILVAQQHCTPEQAFELFTRLSQTTHRKLRDCAADLVTSTAKDQPAE